MTIFRAAHLIYIGFYIYAHQIFVEFVSERSEKKPPTTTTGATCSYMYRAGADPENFQKGVEEENFKRKMFVDTRINACTHEN